MVSQMYVTTAISHKAKGATFRTESVMTQVQHDSTSRSSGRNTWLSKITKQFRVLYEVRESPLKVFSGS